jgi:hypothetical protein
VCMCEGERALARVCVNGLERHRAQGLGFRVYAIHSTLPRICGFGSQAEGLRLRSGLGDGGEEGDLISVHQQLAQIRQLAYDRLCAVLCHVPFGACAVGACAVWCVCMVSFKYVTCMGLEGKYMCRTRKIDIQDTKSGSHVAALNAKR